MPITIDDYYAAKAFDPGVMAARAWQIEKTLWYDSVPKSPQPNQSALYGYALPTINNQPPTPGLYSTTADALFAADYEASRPSAQQALWDALGISALQRAPTLAPLYNDLTTRGGGLITPDVWTDFRSSDLFDPTTETLAYQARMTMRQASTLVGQVVAKGGRWALRAAGWLLDIKKPPITPMKVGVSIVRLVGQEVALDLAGRGFKSILKWLREDTQRPQPLPPLPGPYPPTGPPSGSYRLLQGSRGLAERDAVDFEVVTFTPPLAGEAPPFLAREPGPSGMPSFLLNVGGGWFR